MSEFKLILLEGPFHVDSEGNLKVNQAGSELDVSESFRELKGQRVQVALHYIFPNGPEPHKWGAGCCLWQERLQPCPVGHHANSNKFLNFVAQGVLYQENGWYLKTFEGFCEKIPIFQLDGHYGRIAAASLSEVDKMRDLAEGSSVEALGARIHNLKDLLEKVRGLEGS